MAEKLLIVNADDFGAHEDVNHGIIRAHRAGLVRSASLMVNMPAAEHAARLAKGFPELQVGLHFNLTSGFCVSPASEANQVADERGRFLFDEQDVPTSIRRLSEQAEHNEILLGQMANELRRQMEKFERMGLRLSHINSHHYIALFHSRFFAIHLRAAEAAQVPLRGLCYPMIELLSVPADEVRRIKELVRDSRIALPDLSVSNLWDCAPERGTAEEYRRLMESNLAGISRREEINSVEIITHPALLTPRLGEADDYLWARELENELVMGSEFNACVTKMGFRVGGYDNLSRVAAQS